MGFKRDNFQDFRRRVATDKDSQYVYKKKCFLKLKEVEKLTTTLKTFENALGADVLGKVIIRIKRGRERVRDRERPGPTENQASLNVDKYYLGPVFNPYIMRTFFR